MQIYRCVTNISKFLINLPPPFFLRLASIRMAVFVDSEHFLMGVSTEMPLFVDSEHFLMVVSTEMPLFVDSDRFLMVVSTEMPLFVDGLCLVCEKIGLIDGKLCF